MELTSEDLIKWCNDNSGFVSVLLFLLTLLLAWISGLFRLLRNKPRFVLSILPGPNFACTYTTGAKYGEYDVTRTFFALYLNVANTGSAPGSIEHVTLGYKWSINRLNRLFLKYVIGWCWLHTMISLSDFRHVLKSGGAKFYPFLIQQSTVLPSGEDLYLPVGKSRHGVIYFEQRDSWGGCQPLVIKGQTLVKLRVVDAFGRKHTRRFRLLNVTLTEARKYNADIGKTYDEI
jgi:hypothetical protein